MTENRERLAPEEEQQLHQAMLAAFPFGEMQRLVRFEMQDDITHIAAHGNLSDQWWALITHYQNKGRIMEFLRALRKTNPGNPTLKAAAERILNARMFEENHT